MLNCIWRFSQMFITFSRGVFFCIRLSRCICQKYLFLIICYTKNSQQKLFVSEYFEKSPTSEVWSSYTLNSIYWTPQTACPQVWQKSRYYKRKVLYELQTHLNQNASENCRTPLWRSLAVNQPLCLHCVIFSVVAAQMRRCRRLAVILADVNNGCSSDQSPAAVLWS